MNTTVNEPNENAPMANTATDTRTAAFTKFVNDWANEKEQPEFIVCGLIANKLCYTRDWVQTWFYDGAPISDTAWKKLCKVWPELDQH